MASRKNESPLMESKARFLNREISWLRFNMRVLEEALNPAHPLLERVHFLAISASNLDEFLMVRVAGLKDYLQNGVSTLSIDGLSPAQELASVQEQWSALVQQQHECWIELRKLLRTEGISVVKPDDLSQRDLDMLERDFLANIFPVLTPIAIDPAHPFPFLPNLSMALVFQLVQESKHKKQHIAIVPLPHTLPRFISIPGKKIRYALLEDVIACFHDRLLPGFRMDDSALFRVVRDSELDVEEEGDDFVRDFERAVKRRRRGKVIQIKFAAPASHKLVQFVSEQLHVDLSDVIEVQGLLGLASLKALCDQGPAELKFPPFKARFPERINDFGGDCFAAIAAKDIVIHHPFESFDVVIQFLRQAARDPHVVSIKQTLYRTSHDSPIIRALIEAAEAGKSVTALVELKARFDEEANLRLARELEAAGAQVVYGFVGLKTHAKVSLVTRREGGKLMSYVHFGTGNYHPTTARSYTDLSFFTCDAELCRDAAYFFNFITGYAPPKAFSKLIVAPRHMRRRLLRMIEEEAEHARAGRPAVIWAKMNALVDQKIIDALYRASQDGVTIELVVRGICCLRPGVAGLSENIRVKSIVGRFLEHSRIYCFGNGHALPSPHARVFIGSADWMPRNFDGRVETIVPIENPTVHEQILGQIMVANIRDEKQSWLLGPDGAYRRITPADPVALSAHDYFMLNPSLSGRGTALKKVASTQISVYTPARGDKAG